MLINENNNSRGPLGAHLLCSTLSALRFHVQLCRCALFSINAIFAVHWQSFSLAQGNSEGSTRKVLAAGSAHTLLDAINRIIGRAAIIAERAQERGDKDESKFQSPFQY